MQTLPEAPTGKEAAHAQRRNPLGKKKEACSLLAATSGMKIPKSILLLVESTMHPSLDDALANFSTSSSRLFYQRPTTKNTK